MVAPTIEAAPTRPERPAALQWEWHVLVDGVRVGLGRRVECEGLAEELRAAPWIASSLRAEAVADGEALRGR